MKNIALLTFYFFLQFCIYPFAQKGIEIIYNVQPVIIEKENIDKGIETSFLLTLADNKSNYKYIEKLLNYQNLRGSYGFIKKSGILYKDINASLFIENTNIYNKNILISDSLPKFNWEMKEDTKSIIDLPVKKAISKLDEFTEIIAWYSPFIPLNNGPDIYGGLPGLILELEVKNEKNNTIEITRYIAEKIINKEKINIIIPNKGEKMSLIEYKDFSKRQDQIFFDMYNNNVDKD